MKSNFNQEPLIKIRFKNREISIFKTEFESQNIDLSIMKPFGEEWKKFQDEEIKKSVICTLTLLVMI